MADKDVYGGVIHLHILHYTMLDPIFGLGITKELRHHGYEFSAGALSSMLR